MKLQILVPQYHETEKELVNLLNSIMIQQGIDLQKDIEVIIGNDGSDIFISEDFLKKYPFKIRYEKFKHINLAGCRQNLFDIATAEYVMFCDSDDMFLTVNALNSILLAIDVKRPKIMAFDFYEEVKSPNNKFTYHCHHNDNIWVHGKVYQRQFILNNDIKWHPEVETNEDSCFNVLAFTLAEKEHGLIYFDDIIYLWKWRDGSITRKTGSYTQDHWDDLIDSFNYNIKDFLDRGFGDEGKYWSAYCMYATYYSMLDPKWDQPDMAYNKEKTIKKLKQFYNDHKLLIKNLDPKQKDKAYIENRKKLNKKGIYQESITYEDWFKKYILDDE